MSQWTEPYRLPLMKAMNVPIWKNSSDRPISIYCITYFFGYRSRPASWLFLIFEILISSLIILDKTRGSCMSDGGMRMRLSATINRNKPQTRLITTDGNMCADTSLGIVRTAAPTVPASNQGKTYLARLCDFRDCGFRDISAVA